MSEEKQYKIPAADREMLTDELFSLENFGQAIEEPYVELAARRCLRLIGAEDLEESDSS